MVGGDMNIRSRISGFLLPGLAGIALLLSGCAQQRELGWCTVYGATAGALICAGAGFGIGDGGWGNRRGSGGGRGSLLLRSDRSTAASSTTASASSAPATTAASRG